MEEIRPEFDKLVETYHSQAAGRLGQILYGHILLNADKPEAAVDMFKKAWDDYGDDPVLANIILNGLSVAYLRIGDKAAAMAQMEKIVAGSATTHKDAALFRLGLLYLESGQKDKGKDLFKKLSEEFPNSMYVEMAKEQASG